MGDIMQLYYEIAYGNAKNRGHFVKAEDVSKLYGSKYAHGLVYKSVYAYDEYVLDWHKEHKSMSKYPGIRYLEEVCFDIDKKENSDKHTYQKAVALLQYLEDLGIDEFAYQIYWSGRAWHIHTSNKIWGFKASADLPYFVKETLKKVLGPLGKGFYDETIYSPVALFRLAHTLNVKSDSMMYKMPVSKSEFLAMDIDYIKDLAKEQRLNYDVTDYKEILDSDVNKLSHLILTETETKPSLDNYSKAVQRSNVAMCIHKLIEKGASEGNRNNSLLRIATHLRRNNIPEEFVIAGLVGYWNEKNGEGLEEAKVIEMVRKTYRSPYNYGCNDSLLKANCNPNCIFYHHRNYSQHVLSSEDMMNELELYRNMERDGKVIDLAKLFNLEDKDLILEPGDLMVIVGGTGVNKTTLMQQIALAMNFETGIIDYENQIPTLIIELELTTAKLMRRFAQLVCGIDKREALVNLDKYKDQVNKVMSNVILTREVRNIQQLKQKIIDTQAKLIIIDYLQCFKDFTKPVNEMQLMASLPHELRDLATEMGVIIIVLSQVTKSAKQEKAVNMDSGKGSGDISDSASVILTINGEPDDVYRKIKFEKVTDGDTITDGIILQFNKDKFRLERI